MCGSGNPTVPTLFFGAQKNTQQFLLFAKIQISLLPFKFFVFDHEN
jgi:hypothetical protein